MLHYFKVNNCVQVSTTYITQITTAKLNYSNHFQQIVKKLDPVQNSRNVQKKKILTLNKLTCLVSKYLLKIPTPKKPKTTFFSKKYMKIPLEKKNQFQNSIFSILTKKPAFSHLVASSQIFQPFKTQGDSLSMNLCQFYLSMVHQKC